jgi:flagellar basal-body rod protein FlgB
VSDITMTAVQVALRGLALRQRAIADNIANVETPGYQAERVDFEGSLRNALDGLDPQATSITTSRSLDPTNQAGNNVKLDDETVSLIDTNLRYQLAVEAASAKFRLLRTAIKGQ